MPSRSAISAAWTGADRGAYRAAMDKARGAEAGCVKVDSAGNVSFSRACMKSAVKPVAPELRSVWTD